MINCRRPWNALRPKISDVSEQITACNVQLTLELHEDWYIMKHKYVQVEGSYCSSDFEWSAGHPSGTQLRIGETPEERIERLAVTDVNRRQLRQQEVQQHLDRLGGSHLPVLQIWWQRHQAH